MWIGSDRIYVFFVILNRCNKGVIGFLCVSLQRSISVSLKEVRNSLIAR